MKETDLNLFYQFGKALDDLYSAMKIGSKAVEIFGEMYLAQTALIGFLKETEDYKLLLVDTRVSAQVTLDTVNDIMNSVRLDLERIITQSEVSAIFNSKLGFDKHFERECRKLSVFTVTPKALLDTRLLVESAELKFGENTRSVFTERIIYDLRQAGRCLAFEAPTAMAFHVMRATESLIKLYYETLAKKPWPYPQRDWGKYIVELEKFPEVKAAITTRLKEIKDRDRNPLIHPEDVVSLEEAPIIFDLCNGVIYSMAEEVRKRKQ